MEARTLLLRQFCEKIISWKHSDTTHSDLTFIQLPKGHKRLKIPSHDKVSGSKPYAIRTVGPGGPAPIGPRGPGMKSGLGTKPGPGPGFIPGPRGPTFIPGGLYEGRLSRPRPRPGGPRIGSENMVENKKS